MHGSYQPTHCGKGRRNRCNKKRHNTLMGQQKHSSVLQMFDPDAEQYKMYAHQKRMQRKA
jgi:hypothetical protein